MKKVLVISYYFPPYSGGSVMRIHNFVKYLPSFNFYPLVLTLDENYYEKLYYNPSLLNEYSKIVKIFRTKSLEFKSGNIKDKVYGLKKKNILDRFFLSIIKKIVSNTLIPDYHILWLPYALLKGHRIIRRNSVDLIFSTSPPFSSNIIACLLSRLSGKPFVVEYRDDWIGNEFYNVGKTKNALEKKIEMLIIKSAAKVITATYNSIELFRGKYPNIDSNKYFCIPNGFDPEYFDNFLVKGLLKYRIHDDQKFVFTYVGSLTIKRDPRFFLYSIKEIIEEDPTIKQRLGFVFIGFCHYKHKELVKRLGLEKIVSFISQLSPSETAKFLQEKTDVCLLFQRRSEGGKTAIPGKLYEYLASRKPILCMDDNGATTKFLKSLGLDFNADYEDFKKIKTLIKEIINNYQEIANKYILDLKFIDNFNRKKQSGVLAKIFDKILEKNNKNDRSSK